MRHRLHGLRGFKSVKSEQSAANSNSVIFRIWIPIRLDLRFVVQMNVFRFSKLVQTFFSRFTGVAGQAHSAKRARKRGRERHRKIFDRHAFIHGIHCAGEARNSRLQLTAMTTAMPVCLNIYNLQLFELRWQDYGLFVEGEASERPGKSALGRPLYSRVEMLFPLTRCAGKLCLH